MNKKFLQEQMKKLETNYGREKFVITKDIFDLWHEIFADCNEEGFKLAVEKYMEEHEFAPNIAGIMKCYKELETRRNELKETIKFQYTKMRVIWGEDYDSETFNEIVKYIMTFPKNLRRVEMIELQQRAVSFAHDCDAIGRYDKPTIKEYIQGAR